MRTWPPRTLTTEKGLAHLHDDLLAWARDHLDVESINGDEVNALCPYHNERRSSFSLNVDKGVFNCFACGAAGVVHQLATHLGVEAPGEAPAPTQAPEMDRAWANDLRYRLQQSRVERPDLDGLLVAPTGELDRCEGPHEYWETRGITEDVRARFRLGYDVLADAVTIPIFSLGGHYLGSIRRHLGNVEPRYLYPTGLQKGRVLWGANHARTERRVAVVEGSIDALRLWSLGVPAVAVLGSQLHQAQLRLLERLGADLYLGLGDGDEAGQRLNETLRDALTPRWPFRAVELPEGEDPGSMDATALLTAIAGPRRLEPAD
jgi:DNA primase